MRLSSTEKPKLKQVVKALSPVLKPRRVEFLVGILLVFGSTACEVMSPIFLGKGVDIAISQNGTRTQLLKIALGFLSIICVRALTETCQGFVIQRTGQKVIHDLRVLVFQKIHSLSISYFDSHPTGRLLTRVVNDIKSVSELFTASISVLILDVMIILGSLVTMFAMDWKLAFVVLVSFPLVFWTIWNFGEKLSEAYKNVRTYLSEINAFLGENIGAVATIQRLGAENVRFTKFEKIVENHTEAQLKSLRVYALVQPYANVLNGVAMATLMGFGGYWTIQGRITLGVLVAFLAYLRNLFQPIRDLVEKYNTFLSAMVAAERIVVVLNESSEPREQLTGRSMKVLENHSVSFDRVSFGYPTREGLALQDVSFVVNSGESVAIVGATGSGKSTLIRLLMRFYDVSQGEIRFGGVPLQDWNRAELRRHIGVIQQEVYLFSGTIRDNLSLGREGWSDAYLIEQCHKTRFWEFIKNRGGLEMAVFEGGTNLSLGERQLLAFTRTWVFNPSVLIFDEATASIDLISERYLMEAIELGLRGRTSIVIAHRLSTIQACDKIVVIENGRVAEQGTYSSLLRKGGLFFEFHRIYTHQGQSRA
jgi:ATP-binding cassette, subfamily B, multidrug efflux pump